MLLTNKDSFVFYRKPNTKEINYIIGEWSIIQEPTPLNKFILEGSYDLGLNPIFDTDIRIFFGTFKLSIGYKL